MAYFPAFTILAVAMGAEIGLSARVPEVSTKTGELIFSSADGKDIVFQPGVGGSLLLNGIMIKSVADLKGAQGPSGVNGVNGTKGEKGAAGPTGPQGPVGLKGDKGEAGKDGVNGVVGPQGPKGNKGDVGAKGETGPAGANGINGGPGPKGDTGTAGRDGRDGLKGATGPAGQNGSNGVKGVSGQDGKNGAAGAKGDKGSGGSDGKNGAAGPPGPPGPKGDSGTHSSCGRAVLPNCPFWLNLNTSSIPVSGSPVIRFATSGFTELYHPDFEPSYTCHFDGAESSVVSKYVSVTAQTDSQTKRVFYSVDCPAPIWTFSKANLKSYMEKVNVSLWFQEKTIIPFSGKTGADQIAFYVGWNLAQTLPSGALTIIGGGFNKSNYYACQFNSTTPLGAILHVNSSAVQAKSTTGITCIPPHWNFTSDSRTDVLTNVSVWRADAKGNLINKLPFFGVPTIQDQYKYYRCRDGVTNGVETDVDCGGLCPNLCPSGLKCKTNSDCVTKVCNLKTKTCGLPGQDKLSPGKSCKALNWKTNSAAWLNWTSSVIQTYCNFDKTLDGGGWAMVWKHSYFQIDKTQLSRMRTYSTTNQPCIDLSVGWCNVPDKRPPGYTEQMVAAYHNEVLVYAYKGSLNSALGQSNLGPYLNSARQVVDRCNTGRGTKPSISTHSYGERGITFDKWSPDDFQGNCDTDWKNYAKDCRWENCQLPSSISSRSQHTQMTMVIYIR